MASVSKLAFRISVRPTRIEIVRPLVFANLTAGTLKVPKGVRPRQSQWRKETTSLTSPAMTAFHAQARATDKPERVGRLSFTSMGSLSYDLNPESSRRAPEFGHDRTQPQETTHNCPTACRMASSLAVLAPPKQGHRNVRTNCRLVVSPNPLEKRDRAKEETTRPDEGGISAGILILDK
jgi:hypothetical protein